MSSDSRRARRSREGFMDFERTQSLQASAQTPFLSYALAYSSATTQAGDLLSPATPPGQSSEALLIQDNNYFRE